MQGFFIVLMWVFLVIIYMIIFSILSSAIGAGALLGVLTAGVGYGLWRLGRAWSRSIRR